MENLKNFVNTALFHLRNNFDYKVYTRFRLFRTFLSSKLGEERPLVYHSDTLTSTNYKLMEEDTFILTLISYPQHYSKYLTCNNYQLINTDKKLKNPFPRSRVCVNKKCFSVPEIVSRFLKFFHGATVYQNITLKRKASPVKKYLYSLNNFPCPYRFPGHRHIHRNNRPYIIYSSAYTESFHFIYVGCHCDRSRKRVPGYNLLRNLRQ